MFDGISIDQLEQIVVSAEAEIGRLRAAQIAALRLLDEAQIPLADGHRSLQEWVAARLDTGHDDAADLVLAVRSMDDATSADLAGGVIGLKRAVAETRLRLVGVPAERVADSRGLDLAGVRRLAARHRRMTPADEREATLSQHLVIQPSLDESSWRLWGRLDGVDGRIVEKALHQRGDELPPLPDAPGAGVSFRNALALTSICQDSLDSEAGPDGSDPIVTVLVDASAVGESGGQTGAAVANGPRIGPGALDELLCTGRIELNATTEDGTVLGLGDARPAIPPRVRRHVLARDGGCTIEGCRSRYRLQPHHVTHRARGGPDQPGNLATLCWFHHHVVVHRLGHRLDPDSPPGRRRFIRGPAPPADP